METLKNSMSEIIILSENEMVNINGGGAISDIFWYAVGYFMGQKARMENSPTGSLYPGMY